MLYWLLKHVLVGPFLRLFWRPEVIGLENVPVDGPAIIATNHNTFIDSIFVPLVVRRKITYLAKDEYFYSPGIKGWFMARIFHGLGQVPINRSGGTASEAALRTGVKVLHDGNLLGIYPEGTRSPDGKLYRGHTGVARMALTANVKVIPVGVRGTRELQPPGKIIPKIGKITIQFGEPLDFSRFDGMDDDRFVLRSITDEIMYEIMHHCGQQYCDIYASKAKRRLAIAASTGQEVGGVATDDQADDRVGDDTDD